jgi:acyl carrier protein
MGLDGVEIVMTVEDRFCIKLPDAECEKCVTVSDLVEAVIRQLPPLQPIGSDGASEATAYRKRVLGEVRQIIAEQMNIPMDKIRSESRFVQDLGID